MPEKKNKNFLSKFVIRSSMLAFSIFKIIPNLISLIQAEAHLAKKSLVYFIILYLLAGSLLTSFFLCLFAMCFFYLISLQISFLVSLFIIGMINFILLLMILLIVYKVKNTLTFPETRELLRHIIK
jgi:hypothetical protein